MRHLYYLIYRELNWYQNICTCKGIQEKRNLVRHKIVLSRTKTKLANKILQVPYCIYYVHYFDPNQTENNTVYVLCIVYSIQEAWGIYLWLTEFLKFLPVSFDLVFLFSFIDRPFILYSGYLDSTCCRIELFDTPNHVKELNNNSFLDILS